MNGIKRSTFYDNGFWCYFVHVIQRIKLVNKTHHEMRFPSTKPLIRNNAIPWNAQWILNFFVFFLRFGVFSLVAWSFIALVLGCFSSNFGKRFGFVGTSIKFSLEDNFLHHIIVSNSVENEKNSWNRTDTQKCSEKILHGASFVFLIQMRIHSYK